MQEKGCGSVLHIILLHSFDNFVSRRSDNINYSDTLKSEGKTNASLIVVKSVATCTLAVKSITSQPYWNIVLLKVVEDINIVYTYILLDIESDRSFCERRLTDAFKLQQDKRFRLGVGT